MASFPKQNAYGYPSPSSVLFNSPIVAKRDPTSSDLGYPLGQLWVRPSSNSAWVLTSIASNSASWSDISGGAGSFTTLTVNPGPTNLSTVGNGAVTIGNSSNTAAVTIATGTGNFSLTGNGHTVSIANDSAANTLNLGAANTTATTTIAAGSGGILLQGTAGAPITLGVAAQTGKITIGDSTAALTMDILNGVNAAAQTLNVASNTPASDITINVLTSAASAGTQTFNVFGSGATRGGNVNISTGAAAHITTIGTVTNSSLMTILGGNGTGVGSAAIQMSTAAAGDIQIGSAGHTGTLWLGVSTSGDTVNISNTAAANTVNIVGAGATTASTVNIGTGAAAHALTIGSTNGAASTAIRAGSGGISLAAAGAVSMTPSTTGSPVASPTNTVTNNNRVGSCVFTGFTTAAAGKQAFVITNSAVTASSAIFCTVTNVHNANDAQMTLNSVVIAAADGSFTVNTQNNGAGALDGNVIINWWVLS